MPAGRALAGVESCRVCLGRYIGVHRNHRNALLQAFLYCGIDVPELRIAIRMIRSLFRFPVALQTIVQIIEYLRHLRVTDRMFLLGELCGNCPRAFTNPSQRRFRIAACLAINHCFQCFQQTRIRFCDGLASSTRATYAASRRHYPFLNFANSFSDSFSRQATCTVYFRYPAKPQTQSFVGSHNSPRPLIQ